MVVFMAGMKVKGGCVEFCNVLEIFFKSLLRIHYCCVLIFKTGPHVDFCHKMTELILQNRLRAASSALASDIRHLTKDRQLQPSHQGISCDIYILNHSVQPSKDGINLKWPLIVKAASPDTVTCAVVIFFFFCWLVLLMWRLIPKLQGSYNRKQLIVPLPSQFFWAFKLLSSH